MLADRLKLRHVVGMQNAPAPADMSFETWIFDLDNTLYPASCRLFDQVDRRIGLFIAQYLSISTDDARKLQKQYFRNYGTTLRGLMLEHGVDPQPFLDFVHEIDLNGVPSDPLLDRLLGLLPGRKFVYTNGSARHADNILGRLGVARHFAGVFDIVAAGFIPKPDPRPYAAMLDRFSITPQGACMVEDIARNLTPAKALGMTTVWLRSDADFAQPQPQDLSAVDEVIDDLTEWLTEQLNEQANA